MSEIKKTIKIKYIDFWGGFNAEEFYITQILKKHFNVVICDDPDYIISSIIRDFYSYVDYPQVRILYSGENYLPDLNFVDYAITPYPIQLLDRCCHVPQGLRSHETNEYLRKRSTGEIKFDSTLLQSKTVFANFCASHESEYGLRGDFFKKLCEYKKVDSIGTYLNNTGVYVNNGDGSKSRYAKKCKFSLCFESTSHGGFNTEKIVDAFRNDTIPIYFGDPYIGTIFNKKAFIDVADYSSFDEAIAEIIRIDNNDQLYLEMINQPVFNDPDYAVNMEKNLEEFLIHIFDQPLEKAKRQSTVYFAQYYENFIRHWRKIYYSPMGRLAVRLKNKIKR